MTRPIRVAFDNSVAGRNLAGTGVYATQLIQYLSAMQGIHLRVFEGLVAANAAAGPIARGFRKLARLAWNHVYFPLALRRESFDIMHSPAFVAPFSCPCPTVVTIHDLSFLLYPQHFDTGWGSYVTAMMPSVLRSASAIICISQSTKRDLLRFYKVAESKVHVVHQGMDHCRFHPGVRSHGEWKSSVGIRNEYLLHLGELIERKNIPVLLRAVARLRDRGKFDNYQVVVAGSQSSELGARNIKETISRLDLGDLVVLTGHVPDEQLAGLYAGAKLLAMPSMYEGFGNPVLEAMAVGTPVVASDTSSLPEIAGDAALLVPVGDDQALADAIQNLLEDRALGEQLRVRGLARVQQFSWRRTAEETAEVYRAVVGTKAA